MVELIGASLLQISGREIASPDSDDPLAGTVHFRTIVRGRQIAVHVAQGFMVSPDQAMFQVPLAQGLDVFGVIRLGPIEFEIVALDQAAITSGVPKGVYAEVYARRHGTGEWTVGSIPLRKIVNPPEAWA